VPEPPPVEPVADAPDVTPPEPDVEPSSDLRHWHRASGDLRLPAARPLGMARDRSRVTSGGWHRV